MIVLGVLVVTIFKGFFVYAAPVLAQLEPSTRWGKSPSRARKDLGELSGTSPDENIEPYTSDSLTIYFNKPNRPTFQSRVKRRSFTPYTKDVFHDDRGSMFFFSETGFE